MYFYQFNFYHGLCLHVNKFYNFVVRITSSKGYISTSQFQYTVVFKTYFFILFVDGVIKKYIEFIVYYY